MSRSSPTANALVHCSGPSAPGRRSRVYELLRPKTLIPAHGEPLHLSEHVAFAKAKGIGHVISPRRHDAACAWPAGDHRRGRARPPGRGRRGADRPTTRRSQRRRLAFAGVVSIALGLTSKGDLAGDPDVVMSGLRSAVVTAKPRRGRRRHHILHHRRTVAPGVAIPTASPMRSSAPCAARWPPPGAKKPQVHVLVLEV